MKQVWWYNLGCIWACLVGFAGLAELAGLGQFNYDEDMNLISHPFSLFFGNIRWILILLHFPDFCSIFLISAAFSWFLLYLSDSCKHFPILVGNYRFLQENTDSYCNFPIFAAFSLFFLNFPDFCRKLPISAVFPRSLLHFPDFCRKLPFKPAPGHDDCYILQIFFVFYRFMLAILAAIIFPRFLLAILAMNSLK